MLPGKSIAIPEILRILRRRLWLILVLPATTLLAALLFSSTIPSVYQADMLIAIEPQRVPDAFVRSTVTMPIEQQLESIKVQVLSRTVLLDIIETFGLYEKERELLPLEDVVAQMRLDVDVSLDRPIPQRGMPPMPGAIHVRYVHTDPQIAARVTQEIGTRFVAQNSTDRGRLAGATNRFLEEQLATSRRQLEELEGRLEVFRERHGKALPTQMQGNMQALGTAQFQAQSIVESAARDRDRKLMLERLYREAAAEPAAPPPNPGLTQPTAAAGTATTATAADQLAASRLQLESLLLRYKPDHPDVVRTRRLIEELEPKADAEARLRETDAPNALETAPASADPLRRESLRQMRAEIESLDRQIAFKESEERRVRGEIAEYQRRIEAVPGLESEWIKLTRDYDTQQIAYRELLAKSAAAQVAANLESEDIGERFRIVDAAAIPVHPLPSMRRTYNAAGLGAGLVLALGIAALLELKDQSFRSDADVLDVLGVPVLATVPRIWSASERAQSRKIRIGWALGGMAYLSIAAYATWTLKLWKSVL